MLYASLIVFVVMANLSFSAANSGRNPIAPLNSNYAMPPYGQNDVINVGNGVNRNNVVVLDERTNNMAGSYPNGHGPNNPLGNRFGADTTRTVNLPNPGPTRTSTSRQGSVTNIGNGFQNHNTVVTIDSNRRPVSVQSSNVNGRTNTGTSFVAQRGSGLDLFNVGYGSGNKNQVLVNGRPLQPDHTDSRGSTYHIHRENTVGEGNRQPSEVETQLKTLYTLSQHLQQISSRLIQEAAKLNVKL